ncbi:Zn-dependent protease with chaperone function [Singulisphaera sp. GP187]|uniref:M48 family metallopeptidase n=1 Tax=Singulisphaera sp. GP187 TaxID=1882752 RepID=UPI0009287715|nr:M56 family metallopeptidase [Singulisphaera sp. GP187]SIN71898.1 Zn-dependent protease with chaperone function [Singulisphaera sp. GP187]
MSLSIAVIALLLGLASFGLGWLMTWLGVTIALRGIRQADNEPWFERARRVYPARQLVAYNAVFWPVYFGVLLFVMLAQAPISRGASLSAAIGGFALSLGSLVEGNRLERRLSRPSRQPGATGIALHWILTSPGLFVFATMLALIPTRMGWAAVAVLTLGTAIATFFVSGAWLTLLVRFGLAGPASPRLTEIVERAATRVGIRPRAIFELRSPNSMALALPVSQSLVFTMPILDALEDDELVALAVHELGHLNEPRIVYMTQVAGAYLSVVSVAAIPLAGSYGVGAAVVPLAVFFLGRLVLGRFGRRMEERSDELGHAHEGETAGTYARALEKMYEANLMPVVGPLKEVHPHLYDRMITAGVTPDYPRPMPPPRNFMAHLPSIVILFLFWVWLGSIFAPSNQIDGESEALTDFQGRHAFPVGLPSPVGNGSLT